jgi:transcriptional regulator with XRE-family HTH domain
MLNPKEITRRREALKLSKVEAAARVGFSPQQWNNLEAGRMEDPRAFTVQRMAAALECSMDDLMMPIRAKKKEK